MSITTAPTWREAETNAEEQRHELAEGTLGRIVTVRTYTPAPDPAEFDAPEGEGWDAVEWPEFLFILGGWAVAVVSIIGLGAIVWALVRWAEGALR